MKKEEISFEEAISKLEDIANKLEGEDLSLDESTQKFEEGMELAKKCNKMLNDAEKKIMMLVNENGKLKEEEFLQEEE